MNKKVIIIISILALGIVTLIISSIDKSNINKNLIKNRERIIEVPENKNKDGNKQLESRPRKIEDKIRRNEIAEFKGQNRL